ncbi:hypothetical protein Esti_003651 [Eimeria stiedai]
MPPNEADGASTLRRTTLFSPNSFNARKKPSTAVESRWVFHREQGCRNATTASKIISKPALSTTQDTHPTQSGQNVGGFSRKNPPPAPTVFVDVSISAVLLMLRKALRAAFEEVAAPIRGDHGRFSMTKRLHRRLERLWLLPSQRLLSGIRKSRLDDFVVQLHNASRGQKSAPSYIRASPTVSAHTDICIAQADTKIGQQQMEASQFLGTQIICLDSYRVPMVTDDDKAVSPPIELLAAYVDISSKVYPSSAQSGITATATANPVPEGPHSPSKKPGCVVGLCGRHLLDLFIQAIRSLHPALLPEGSVVLMAAGTSSCLLRTALSLPWVCCTEVRSRIVPARMRSIQALYPFNSRRVSLKKLCVTLKGVPSAKSIHYEELSDTMQLTRVGPRSVSTTLCEILKRDLSDFVAQRSQIFNFSQRLQILGLQIPGSAAAFKTVWLFPVLPPPNCNAAEFAHAMRNNVMYAARDAGPLVCCNASPSGAEKMIRPVLAADIMSRIVYLPINRRVTHQQLLQVEAAMAKTVAMFHSNEDFWGPLVIKRKPHDFRCQFKHLRHVAGTQNAMARQFH